MGIFKNVIQTSPLSVWELLFWSRLRIFLRCACRLQTVIRTLWRARMGTFDWKVTFKWSSHGLTAWCSRGAVLAKSPGSAEVMVKAANRQGGTGSWTPKKMNLLGAKFVTVEWREFFETFVTFSASALAREGHRGATRGGCWGFFRFLRFWDFWDFWDFEIFEIWDLRFLGWGRNGPEWSVGVGIVQNGHFTATGIQSDPAELNSSQIPPREIKIPNQNSYWKFGFSKMSFRGGKSTGNVLLFLIPGSEFFMVCFPSAESDWTALEGTDVRFEKIFRLSCGLSGLLRAAFSNRASRSRVSY